MYYRPDLPQSGELHQIDLTLGTGPDGPQFGSAIVGSAAGARSTT